MEVFMQSHYNPILASVIVGWFIAQLLKTLITFITTKKIKPHRMIGAGGIPSAHSAAVCALSVGIGRTRGVASPEFALAVTLAAVVLYDAMGIRRAAGEQAKVLNDMLRRDEACTCPPLNENLGHRPVEVFCGILIGVLISFLMV
jgi:acid phosphatase family membrane protein YuiD